MLQKIQQNLQCNRKHRYHAPQRRALDTVSRHGTNDILSQKCLSHLEFYPLNKEVLVSPCLQSNAAEAVRTVKYLVGKLDDPI